jgi:hypothetical protein
MNKKHNYIELFRRKLFNRKGRKGNIIMFHTARCGSTVLGDLLGRHPDIIWGREIFNANTHLYIPPDWHRNPVRKTIEWHLYRQSTPYFGFETTFMPSQQLRMGMIGMDLEQYCELLDRVGISHYIILKRENFLRRAVSAQVALESKKYHTREDKKEASSIKLDTGNFQLGNQQLPLPEVFESMEKRYALLEEILKDKQVLQISYEKDILPDTMLAFRKVCDFLKIPEAEVTSDYKRTNPFPLKQIIVNYEEVENLLKGTRFEWMLEKDQ